MTARSLHSETPSTFTLTDSSLPAHEKPRGFTTPVTTWLFVTAMPLSSMMKPLPELPALVLLVHGERLARLGVRAGRDDLDHHALDVLDVVDRTAGVTLGHGRVGRVVIVARRTRRPTAAIVNRSASQRQRGRLHTWSTLCDTAYVDSTASRSRSSAAFTASGWCRCTAWPTSGTAPSWHSGSFPRSSRRH